MKQIIQDLKSGKTILEEVPAPTVRKGHVLIQTTRSLVSLGTERMLVEFGKANLIAKARQQPDKVKMVLDKIQTDGLVPTLEAVFNKLGQPLPLGYCNVGKVVAVGQNVSGFKVGDRVASNGPHAEFVTVPKNLVAKVPDEVSDEEAAFTVIGAIGLQGVRLLRPTFGETIVVVGLGLIGLIAAELLLASGCRVIGLDFDEEKLRLARSKGAITLNAGNGADPVAFAKTLTNSIGVDGVLITASSKSQEIISQAAQMSRKRGRIILVGVIGLNLNRAEFYEKELTFQVSCSYGPGRYDSQYEDHGIDYPLPFVRWTENRNFQAILFAIASGKLSVSPLISELVDLQDYNTIYGDIGSKRTIASILRYPESLEPVRTVDVHEKQFVGKKGVIGIIGAGNFTKMTLLPAFRNLGANLKYIVSAGGVNATVMAQKHGIAKSTTDFEEVLADDEVDTIMITTRHNLHASMIVAALNAGKHVFVEKPLATNQLGLDQIIQAYKGRKQKVLVGFNRRFSPHVQQIKKLIRAGKTPMHVVATMNAGFVPGESWVQDMEVGGGRIIGEACHYIDLITFLTGCQVKSVCMNTMGEPNENTDNATILLRYDNGSNGVINYFSNGNKAYPKERVEVFVEGKILILDNFRVLKGYGFKGFSTLKTKLDKGHRTQFTSFIDNVKTGGAELIPFADLVNTTQASFAAIESMKKNSWIEL